MRFHVFVDGSEKSSVLRMHIVSTPNARTSLPELIIDNDEPQNMGRKFWMDQFVSKAIDQAAGILQKIDERWASGNLARWCALETDCGVLGNFAMKTGE
jgi:hypothetical protein